jgi:hypothetical protein
MEQFNTSENPRIETVTSLGEKQVFPHARSRAVYLCLEEQMHSVQYILSSCEKNNRSGLPLPSRTVAFTVNIGLQFLSPIE